MSKASRRAEPWPTTHQRLGAFSGLIAQVIEDHRTLCYTYLNVREPRPPMAPPPSY
jgi:hypothetical protein